jgi:hypothetical protein
MEKRKIAYPYRESNHDFSVVRSLVAIRIASLHTRIGPRSGLDAMKKKFLALPVIESGFFGCLARGLVIPPTESSRLLKVTCTETIHNFLSFI